MITPGIVAAQAAAIGSGGTEFTPPVSSGLQLYLDARDFDALSNGANVSTWTDLSGNARNCPAATGGSFIPPTFARDTFGTGAHSIRFGANKAYRIPNFFHSFTAGEIFLVVKVDADPAVLGANTGLYSWNPGAAGTNYPWTDGVIYDAFLRNGFVTVGNPSRSLTLVNVVNVSNQAGASGYVYRLNATQIGAAVAGSITPATAGTDGWLGSYPTGVFLAGNMGALLLYNRVLNSTERADTYAWLQAQWPGLP